MKKVRFKDITILPEDVVEKKAKKLGNSAYITVPVKWLGMKVYAFIRRDKK